VIVLVSGATRDVAIAPNHVGVLVVPAQGNRIEALSLAGRVWAIDNGAYSGLDHAAFIRLLADAEGVPGCKFVAAPDVVGDAAATLSLFVVWGRMIRALGYPVALVAQDGLTVEATPWHGLDALFIGGTTAWKRSGEKRRPCSPTLRLVGNGGMWDGSIRDGGGGTSTG
jgi:hypothetical protein